MVSRGQKSRGSSARTWPGLQSSESLTGAEGTAPKLKPFVRRPQFLTMDLFTTWQLASLRTSNSRNRVIKTNHTLPFYDLVSKTLHHYFYFILSIISKSLSLAHIQKEEN